jgi:microcystin-dependent protein
MTKARDLAGFSTGSITNTTADGLILKGDGSSTDVVIKNGADATVASVADGTVNIAAAGSITATGAVTRALTRGSIDVGNASGVSAPLAAGGADTVLTSDGTDLSFVAASTGVPTGSIIYHAANSAPTGFLKANGATVSRSTYSALFAVIGTTFGAGDGSSTFLVPDLRGEFLRGWDDSRGIDSGRSFGSAQADQMEAHTHTYNKPASSGSSGGWGWYASNIAVTNTSSQGGTSNSSENRPRNIALLACIKI